MVLINLSINFTWQGRTFVAYQLAKKKKNKKFGKAHLRAKNLYNYFSIVRCFILLVLRL